MSAACITLAGVAEPIHSYELRDRLVPLTTTIRPHVVVDLSDVVELHPSVLSVLIRQRRQAHRQGGSLHLVAPTARDARQALDRVGLLNPGR